MEIMVSIYFESMISNSTLHGKIKFLSWSLLRRYFIFENTVERLKSSRDYLFFSLNPLFKNGLTKQKSSTNHVKLLNLGEGIK